MYSTSLEIDLVNNQVILSKMEDPLLFDKRVIASNLNVVVLTTTVNLFLTSLPG